MTLEDLRYHWEPLGEVDDFYGHCPPGHQLAGELRKVHGSEGWGRPGHVKKRFVLKKTTSGPGRE